MSHPLIAKALSYDKKYSAQWSVFQNSILLQVWEKDLARQDALLTLDDFAHVHPLLPGALWASMASNLGNSGRESCYDEEVLGTLAYLNGETVLFQDADAQACLMYDLKNVEINHDGMVNVTGQVITLETCEYGAKEVPYVTTATRCTVQVTPEEMSEKYPDWDKRLNVAQGLTLEQSELARFVFAVKTTPLSDPSLSGVSFE